MATIVKTIWNGSLVEDKPGDMSVGKNWEPWSLVNEDYSWTLSGSGTNEYYVRNDASASPNISGKPGAVAVLGTDLSEGTLGSLTAGQWAYGDNDTLGYSTVYVRLQDNVDPDTKDYGHVTIQTVPFAAYNLEFPASGAAVTANCDISDILVGQVDVLGMRADIGTNSNPFRFKNTGEITWNHLGRSIVHLHTTNRLRIVKTGTGQQGARGMRLSFIDNIANQDILQLSGDVIFEDGTMTGKDWIVSGGRLEIGSGTSIEDLETRGNARAVCNQSATLAALRAKDTSEVDFTQSLTPRTVTSTSIEGDAKVHYDPSIVTLTGVTGRFTLMGKAS